LAVAIALMGNAGIKGSDAGTSLKTMLQNLIPTTDKQIALSKELGLITKDGSNAFFDAAGNVKDLASISEILKTHLAGLTAEQKSLALQTLFGSDAIRAAAILADNGAAGFDKLAAAMGKVTAADVAKKRMDNVAGSLEQLKGSLDSAAIAFGSALLPVIKKVTDFVTLLVNKFLALDERWQKAIAFAAVAVTAFLGVVAAIAAIAAVVAGAIASLAALKIAAIIVGVVAAVTALAIAIKLAYDHSQAFRDLIGSLANFFKAAFGLILSIVLPIAKFFKEDLIPAVKEMGQTLAKNLQPAFKAIGEFIQNRVVPGIQKLQAAIAVVMPYIIQLGKFLLEVAKVVVNILGKALGFLVPLLLNILGPVFTFLIDAIAAVISFIPTLISWFKKIIDVIITVGKWVGIAIIAPFYLIYQVGKFVFEALMSVVKVFVDAFLAVFNFLWPGIKAVFDLIAAIIGVAFDVISAIFQAWWIVIKALWDLVWSFLIQPIVAAFTAIWDFLKAAFGVIVDIANVFWGVLKAIWGFIWEWIVQPIIDAWNAISDFIGKKMDEAKAIVKLVWDIIVGLFTDARDRVVKAVEGFTAFVTKLRDHFDQAKQAALTKLQEIVDFVKSLPGKVLDALGNVGSTLFNAGKALIQGFWDGMKAIWNNMTSWVEDGMSWLRGLWPFSPAKHGPFSGKGWVLYSGQALVEGFAQGIDSRQDVAVNSAQKALGSVAAVLPTDHSSSVASSQSALSGTPTAMNSSTTSTVMNGDVHITVSLDDIQSVKDLEQLWEWIDNLRNSRRTGQEVPA
jgi:phage-related protein